VTAQILIIIVLESNTINDWRRSINWNFTTGQ